MNPTQLSDDITKHSMQDKTLSHYKLLKKSFKGALSTFLHSKKSFST